MAIVGISGSGKSTIAQLLERFYDVDEGHIYIDGVDIKDYNLATLRKSIGLVSQEPVLFDTTIEENIKYGCPDAAHAKVKECAGISQALHFIRERGKNQEAGKAEGQNNNQPKEANDPSKPKEAEDPNKPKEVEGPAQEGEVALELPEEEQKRKDEEYEDLGLARRVGAKGSELSGGEKQRVAIARALLKEPKILLFDEATSALDSQTEQLVQREINERCQSLTSIVIAHRLGTIGDNDKIFVLENGKIVETGTKRVLEAKKGSFHRLYGSTTATQAIKPK